MPGSKTHSITLREASAFVWHYWRRTPGTVALIAGGIGTAILGDLAMPFVARALAESVQAGQVEQAAGALCLLTGMGLATTACWQFGYRRHEHKITDHMRAAMHDAFRAVQTANADWHANTFAGSTVRKTTRGFWAFAMFSDTLVSGLLPTAVLITGSLGLMFAQWPLMGLCAAASIALYVTAAVLLLLRYVAPANRQAVAQDTALGATIADAVTCNATVKAFGAEAREEMRLAESLALWQHATRTSWSRSINMSAVLSVLAQLNMLAILGTPLWLWQQGRANPADVVYALTAYFLLNGPVRNIANQVRTLQRAVNDLEDIVLLSRMQLDVRDTPHAVPAAITRGEVRFDHVTFRYAGQEAPLYRDLNVCIRAGETVGLVGRSGSGKTTFVKLLQRLYDVNAGCVQVDGQDVRTLTQASLRQRIALVPQEPALFHRSLLDNIRYGRPEATLEEVQEVARQANAHPFIATLPTGYETLVGERGVKLSGGERQRVAIARALLADTPVLVLDEATSSLDSVSERLIQEALDRLMLGRTTIIVAHRLSTLRAVDRILVFDQGRIVEDGSHHSLLQIENGLYRHLYETQTLGLVADEPVVA